MTNVLKNVEKEISSLSTEVKSFSIRSKKDYEESGEYLVSVRLLKKKIIEHYKPIKDKINETRKATLDAEREHLAPLEDAEKKLQEAIRIWRDKLAAKEEERKQKLLEKVREGKSVPTSLQKKVEAPKVESLSFRKDITFEIVDQDKINRKYMVPNKKALRKVTNSLGKDAEGVVGGIRVTVVETPVVKAR